MTMIPCRYFTYGRLVRGLSSSAHSSAQYDQTRREQTESLYKGVLPMIGLEVHAQLKTASKLFSKGSNAPYAPPNSQLDLLDIALPGTLPKLNRGALNLALVTSLALNCTVQDVIHFDRKNYFYADMPAGFQITQYNKPLAIDGYIEFIATSHHKSMIAHEGQYDVTKFLYTDLNRKEDAIQPYMTRSRIKQIQLEQDSAKTLHLAREDAPECHLVDYNRSGAGLVELVFEPDLSNHFEASALVHQLVNTLRAIDTCSCELQEGSLRVDANVSILKIDDDYVKDSGRVEIKNLNSLRSLHRAISYEIERQASLLRAGQEVDKETRSFNTKSGKTYTLRLKEDAVDYRYVPEPSIPPISIGSDLVQNAKTDLAAKLTHDLRQRLIDDYNLDLRIVLELMDEPGLDLYFIDIAGTAPPCDADVIGDFLIYSISNLKKIEGLQTAVDLTPGSKFRDILGVDVMQSIFKMILVDKSLTFMKAFDVMKTMLVSEAAEDPSRIVNENHWSQINDPSQIRELCNQLKKDMPGVLERYGKKGNIKRFFALLKRLCQLSENRINVEMAAECIDELVGRPKK